MIWQSLKKEIYYEDGSLRDVLIKNASKSDWIKWIDFVNQYHDIAFYNGKTERNEPKIDKNVILDYWTKKHIPCSNVSIFLENITIKCYFFDDLEFENDLDPREFKNIEDHHNLINYLDSVSNLLNKEIIVTPENTPEEILISRKPQLSM